MKQCKHNETVDSCDFSYFVYFVSTLLRWRRQVCMSRMGQSDDLRSLSLMAMWCLACAYGRFLFIYVLPLVGLLRMATQFGSKSSLVRSNEPLTHSTVALMDMADRALGSIMAQFDWLVQPETARRNFVKLVYSYLAWIALHQLLDAHHIFQMLGISIILWRHPMIVKVRAHFAGLMFRDVVDALFIGPVAESTVSSQYPLMQRALAYQQSIQSNGHSDRSINDQDFEFVVYENQRRQPFGKWTTGTLPFERSAWSDEAKQPVPPCSKFVLPPPSVMVVESSSHPQRRWQKTWTWVWTDDDWSTDGWEYGTLLWTSFSSHSQKGFWPTRRRQWKRRASIERHVKTVDAPVSVSIKGHVPTERSKLFIEQYSAMLEVSDKHSLESRFELTDALNKRTMLTVDTGNQITNDDLWASPVSSPQSPEKTISFSSITSMNNRYRDSGPLSSRSLITEPDSSSSTPVSPAESRFSRTSADDRKYDGKRKSTGSTGRREAVWKRIVRA